MVKIILIMYLCSNIPGNKCGIIPTPKVMFNDHYGCMIYAYDYSLNLIAKFGRDWVNEKRVFTKFTCKAEQII
tara:strand:- start:304 stop:522 length:219 start_codon:yes stop_codon:yes gene_type:complete